LTLGKIIKIVATRCQILRLKCTKFNFGWGSAPDHAGGAYSAPPDPLAGLSGPTSKGKRGYGKGRKGERDGMGRGREETVREGEGRGGEVRGDDPPLRPPLIHISGYALVRYSKSAQKFAIRVRQVAIVAIETTQLVLSQFKNFLSWLMEN